MELKLNSITQDLEMAVISAWFVAEGDKVKAGQDLLEIVTDKATFDVPAPCDGVLLKILEKEGSEISPEAVIAEIKQEA